LPKKPNRLILELSTLSESPGYTRITGRNIRQETTINTIEKADVLLSHSAYEMARAHQESAITVNPDHLAAAVSHLQVELDPEQAIHLVVRTQHGRIDTEPPLRKRATNTPYIIGDRLHDNSPDARVMKGQIENDLILEGVINNNAWSDPRYTDSVLQKLQEPQRRRSRIQAIVNGAGSLALMWGAVISGTAIAKQTGDTELARAVADGGVAVGMFYGMGMSLIRPAIQASRRANRRQSFIGMQRPLIKAEPSART
jgi:hypothetical protein